MKSEVIAMLESIEVKWVAWPECAPNSTLKISVGSIMDLRACVWKSVKVLAL